MRIPDEEIERRYPLYENGEEVSPPSLPDGVDERAAGSLLGQLAGDSLGSLVEFETEAAIRRRYPEGLNELADGGTWDTIAGQPTDDSELALMLARSTIVAGGFSPEAAAVAYAHWFGSNPFDCGGTTVRALRPAGAALLRGVSAREIADVARKAANPESQANGALMRVSPLGIAAHGSSPDEAAENARGDALLTHPHSICGDANAVYVVAVAHAIAAGTNGRDTYQFVRSWAEGEGLAEAGETRVDGGHSAPPIGIEVRECLRMAGSEAPRDYASHQGWVLIALQNAFWQLVHAPSLEAGVCDTVMRGGDTDTNAAIAGALLGAVHGARSVPPQWRDAILSCRPERGRPGVRRPRARSFWPADALTVAHRLAELGSATDSDNGHMNSET